MAQTAAARQRTGKVVQVIGPVIDIEFPEGLPEIYNAVRIVSDGAGGSQKIDVVAEVEQHLGENRVRTVAMKPTDGMTRGMTVIDTGAADHGAGRSRDARPRAERARRAGRLPGSPGACRRSAGRSTGTRRRSSSSPPS